MPANDKKNHVGSDLELIRKRVREKRQSYSNYNFSLAQNDILKTFFDLAQEFDSLHDFYRICVTTPQESMEVECRLYLLHDDGSRLELVCDSRIGIVSDQKKIIPEHIRLVGVPYETPTSYVIPISYMPRTGEISLSQLKGNLLGMLEVDPLDKLSESDRFFLVKYAGRIAYNLYKRIIARQNVRHLKFINSLVMDIEHNVIIPNMHFRHLFNQLSKKIFEVRNLENDVRRLEASGNLEENCRLLRQRINELSASLLEYYQEIRKHHASLSLFIESLFRRDHFQKGHLVLRYKQCKVEKEIIIPQLERYEKRLAARGIRVARPKDMQEEEVSIKVDIGLLSQVYANLFSNAEKYTEETLDHDGRASKFLAYGREILSSYFPAGQDGIKFNVFTTGPHLSPELIASVFEEGVRGENSLFTPGMGHGLAFIRHVIEIHGGRVGCEPTFGGNNFFFILPLPSPDLVLRP